MIFTETRGEKNLTAFSNVIKRQGQEINVDHLDDTRWINEVHNKEKHHRTKRIKLLSGKLSWDKTRFTHERFC